MVCGCLQPVPVPVPIVDSLESTIKQALVDERLANSALASQVAITPAEADKEKLWMSQHATNATKYGGTIAAAIKAELGKAKTADDISEVWKEVAKGYGN